jgi:4-amino-4-deoxy-L-arabinose transferase-like glycosyltransferase
MEAGSAHGIPPLPPAARSGLERYSRVILVGLILAFLTLGWRGRMPIHLAFDEMTYISVSRSLESGNYREPFSLDAPRHVRYPPGYPAWLMTLRKLGGESHDLVRAFNLAFVAIAILCTYLIVRRLSGVGIGLAAAFVLAFNPALLDAGATLLSEAPFLSLSGAALALCVLNPPQSGTRAYLAMALALASFLTRVAGITVVIAVALWLWHRRRRSELIAFGFASLIVVGGWFAYTHSVPATEAGISYADDLSSGYRNLQHPGWSWKLTRAASLGASYATRGLPSALALPTIPGTAIDNALWLAVIAALGAAGLVVLWRRARSVFWHLVLSAVLIVAWPWKLERLLVPLVPFVAAALLIGADRLTRTFPARRRNLILAGLTVLMVSGAIAGAWDRDVLARGCDRSNPFEGEGCYGVESRNMAAAAHYLRDHAPGNAVVLTVSGPAVNYLSGLVTGPTSIVRRFPPREAAAGLRKLGINYVLITGYRQFERRHLGPWLLGSCREFRIETRFPPAGFILMPEPPRLPSEDACGPLTELVKSKGEAPAPRPEGESP